VRDFLQLQLRAGALDLRAPCLHFLHRKAEHLLARVKCEQHVPVRDQGERLACAYRLVVLHADLNDGSVHLG
jgi:hypothetical protein